MALTDSLISYWALDEASGTRSDSHGSNDLTDVNTVGSATGKINSAADFESSNSERFDHTDSLDLSIGDVDCTFSAWVKLESKTGSNMCIIDKTTTGDGEFFLYYRNDADRFRLDVFGGSSFGSSGSVAADSLGSPSTGVWYFIVAWHDATANTLNIQVNNGAVDSTSHSAGILNGAGDWCVGGDSSFGQYFDGLIDEVGFWKRVLTSDERTSLYNGGAGLAYPFSGGGGGITGPLVGNKHLMHGGPLVAGRLAA